MASGFSLKDQLFNREKVRYLAGLFSVTEAGFDAEAFEGEVMAALQALELKQRITLIAEVLAGHLPEALPEAAPIVLKALPPPLDPGKTDDDFGDFIFAPWGVCRRAGPGGAPGSGVGYAGGNHPAVFDGVGHPPLPEPLAR